MKDQTAGRLMILTAAGMWSTSGFFAKAPWFADWPLQIEDLPVRGPLLAFWRVLFASLVLLPFVRRPRWTPKLVFMVAAYAIMNYTFLNALTLTTAANAIWLQNTSPAWVFLIGVLVFREPVHPRDGWLLACCVGGVGLILCFELGGQSLEGVVFGLLSGLAYAGIVLSLRQLRCEDGAWLLFLSNLTTAAVFLPFVLHYDIWPSGKQTLRLAGFGMFQLGLPYLLFARGVRRVTGHEAAGIGLLEPILVPVWVWIAWRHAPSYQAPQWWTLGGGGLILLGLALRYLWRRPTPDLRQSPSDAQAEGNRA
jgi:drug/metabolite transporter (DMT)-like permease